MWLSCGTTLTFSHAGGISMNNIVHLHDSSSTLCMSHIATVLRVLKGSVDSRREPRIKMTERSEDGH